MKREYIMLVGVLAISLSIILSAFLISNRDSYIKNTGTSSIDGSKILNTISVSGDGVVYAKPNQVYFDITVSELKNTVKEAQDEANKKISQIKEILSKNNIEEKNIQTTNFSIQPEYDYTSTGAILKGYRSNQTLNIKINNIDEKASQAVVVIDQLTEINNVIIGSIDFDIEDKKELFSQARQLAYQKAEQKAKELANLSKVELLDVVSVGDASLDTQNNPSLLNTSYQNLTKESDTSNIQANLSTGQLSVSVNLEVVFGIK